MGVPFRWTQLEAITAVRNTVGDPSGAATERWTQAEIAGYLDRAGQTVILDTGVLLETQWDFSLVTDQQEYVMAENFVEATAVKMWKGAAAQDDQRELRYLTQQQWHQTYERDPIASGEPSHYTLWNKLEADPVSAASGVIQPPIMFVRPVPTSTENGYKIRVWGVKVPDKMDGVDTYDKFLELKGHHVEAQVAWACSLVFWDDDETGKAQAMEARYQRLVEKIKHDHARKDRSRRPRVQPRVSRLTAYDRRHLWPLPQRFKGA